MASSSRELLACREHIRTEFRSGLVLQRRAIALDPNGGSGKGKFFSARSYGNLGICDYARFEGGAITIIECKDLGGLVDWWAHGIRILDRDSRRKFPSAQKRCCERLKIQSLATAIALVQKIDSTRSVSCAGKRRFNLDVLLPKDSLDAKALESIESALRLSLKPVFETVRLHFV